jgi:hypothetical protein
VEEVLEEHIQTAKHFIDSAKRMDEMNLINDAVYNELLKRAETQLRMAELYIYYN